MSDLIGLDWGTSSLRAYRFDAAGQLRETRTRAWGIRHLPDGGFDAALTDIASGWPPCPRLACGMVGSRQGWREAPYMDLPADTARLASALRTVRADDGMDVYIVPGLRNPLGPDVMRGEETQLLGALALRPPLANRSNCILPGTHSKWVSVRDGVVIDFCTVMTGELFALLCEHSILGTHPGAVPADPDAFSRGAVAARESGGAGAFSRLFSARALMLDDALAPAAVPEYLSGLLIGEELRSGLASGRFRPDAPFQLIGDAALCARYRAAALHFDIELAEPVADAAAHGLWQIASRAGLVGTGLPMTFAEAR